MFTSTRISAKSPPSSVLRTRTLKPREAPLVTAPSKLARPSRSVVFSLVPLYSRARPAMVTAPPAGKCRAIPHAPRRRICRRSGRSTLGMIRISSVSLINWENASLPTRHPEGCSSHSRTRSDVHRLCKRFNQSPYQASSTCHMGSVIAEGLVIGDVHPDAVRDSVLHPCRLVTDSGSPPAATRLDPAGRDRALIGRGEGTVGGGPQRPPPEMVELNRV
ncbi:hypothetical protein DESA109040_00770 [Deinococcus saxicola]